MQNYERPTQTSIEVRAEWEGSWNTLRAIDRNTAGAYWTEICMYMHRRYCSYKWQNEDKIMYKSHRFGWTTLRAIDRNTEGAYWTEIIKMILMSHRHLWFCPGLQHVTSSLSSTYILDIRCYQHFHHHPLQLSIVAATALGSNSSGHLADDDLLNAHTMPLPWITLALQYNAHKMHTMPLPCITIQIQCPCTAFRIQTQCPCLTLLLHCNTMCTKCTQCPCLVLQYKYNAFASQ